MDFAVSEETLDIWDTPPVRPLQTVRTGLYARVQALDPGATSQVERSRIKTNLEVASLGAKLLAYFPEPLQVSHPIRYLAAGSTKPTHETSYGLAYVNEIGRTGFTRKPFVFPTGTMIVREKLRALNAAPERLVVMIKHELNFNPKANGWEFLTVSGDGSKVVKRQKTGACLDCHMGAANNDLVFPEDGRYR